MSQGRALRSGRVLPSLDSAEQSSPPIDVSKLCFRDAAVKRGNNEITEDKFLQALLRHCNGTRHGRNRLCTDEPPKPGFVKNSFADDVSNVDQFTSSIAHWISKDVCKDNTRIIDDTTPIFQVLKAYRSDDVATFQAGLADMDHLYEALEDSQSLSRTLCRRLATLIVREQQEKILIMKAILERVHTDMGVDFDIGYQHLKKDKSIPGLLRVINASGFKNRVPRGTSGRKALDWLARDIMFD